MTQTHAIERGERLPRLQLPEPGTDTTVSLHTNGRTATVLIAAHANCEACSSYIAQFTGRDDDIRSWDGRVIVAFDGNNIDAAPAGPTMRFAIDAEHQLNAAGIETPAVLVADQWGELIVVGNAGAAHNFITADEVIDWLRYLAVVCPECQGEAL